MLVLVTHYCTDTLKYILLFRCSFFALSELSPICQIPAIFELWTPQMVKSNTVTPRPVLRIFELKFYDTYGTHLSTLLIPYYRTFCFLPKFLSVFFFILIFENGGILRQKKKKDDIGCVDKFVANIRVTLSDKKKISRKRMTRARSTAIYSTRLAGPARIVRDLGHVATVSAFKAVVFHVSANRRMLKGREPNNGM